MHKTILMLFIILFSSNSWGQTNYEKFKNLFKGKETDKIQVLLNDWRKLNPNDPELYTSEFNYYFSNSKKEVISLQQSNPKKEAFQLTDSIGNVAGYLTSNLSYDQNKLDKALNVIDQGIEKFPDRLDMRFGKIYALGEIEDYKNFTKAIIQTIDYSLKNNNKWLWTENKKQDDGENFMLKTVQTYLKQLYDTEDDNLLPNMIEMGEKVLKHYPNNIEILSTTSIALLLTENYDKAIIYLKKAEQINPKDFIVLNNIAQAYKIKGDKANSIKYYELTEKYRDEQAKYQAQQNIQQLKKQ